MKHLIFHPSSSPSVFPRPQEQECFLGHSHCLWDISATGLGWRGSPCYCWLVSSWTVWQAVVSPCNQKAEGINQITGCNEEFDSCNKTIQLLFTFISIPAIAMEQKSFLKETTCHQLSFIVSSGNLGLCFSRINCTGKFAIKITLLQKLPFPITSCQSACNFSVLDYAEENSLSYFPYNACP